MPNWCENDLYVTGASEDIKKFQEQVKGEENGEPVVLDANKLIPYPEDYAKLDREAHEWSKREEQKRKDNPEYTYGSDRPADGYNQGGYEWCIANWGTKWGFCHLGDVEDNGDEIIYHFDTAWSPPVPLIKKMGEMFPKLNFNLRYFECGAGFNGAFIMSNGEVSLDNSGDYFGDRGG